MKRANANPEVGVLMPKLKAHVCCMFYNKLPFEEDHRNFTFPSLNTLAKTPGPVQLAAVQRLIDSMDLMTNDDDMGESYKPSKLFNPALQRFYQCVERRALNPYADIEALDPVIQAYINPDKAMMDRNVKNGVFKV